MQLTAFHQLFRIDHRSTLCRHWILAATLLLLTLRSISPATAQEGLPELDIIDCHTHFYDPQRPEGVPWPPKDSSLYRTVLPEHLLEQKVFRKVTGTVIVEASPWVEDNAWLLELAKEEPFIVGIVGSLDPESASYGADLERFAANPLFRGIRVSKQKVQTLLDAKRLEGLKMLAEHDLALDVNGGPDTPAEVARLAEQLPELRIVLNHLGNVTATADLPPADWIAGMRAAAEHPNVYCKVSALISDRQAKQLPPPGPEYYRPYLDVIWNAFGEDRVIYASNWPVSELFSDYETLQRLVFEYAMTKGNEATRKFCSLNAQRAYKWVERPGRR